MTKSMTILKYLTSACTIVSIISGVTSFVLGDTLNAIYAMTLAILSFQAFNAISK
jgi:hypothetical protein